MPSAANTVEDRMELSLCPQMELTEINTPDTEHSVSRTQCQRVMAL